MSNEFDQAFAQEQSSPEDTKAAAELREKRQADQAAAENEYSAAFRDEAAPVKKDD